MANVYNDPGGGSSPGGGGAGGAARDRLDPTINAGYAAGAGPGAAYDDPAVAGASPHDGNGHRGSPADALKELGERFGELKAYASYYLTAKADGFKVSLRNLGLYAALGVVGLIAGGAILVTAAVLLLTGLAGAIGAIFDPDKVWVGNLLVGLLVLGGTGLATWLLLKKLTSSLRERTVRKYEQLQRQQRDEFGHNVHERAVRAHEAAGE